MSSKRFILNTQPNMKWKWRWSSLYLQELGLKHLLPLRVTLSHASQGFNNGEDGQTAEQAPFIFIIILLVFLKYASGISWIIRNQVPSPPNWMKTVTRPWGIAIMTGASFLHKVKQNLYADMAGWRIITNVKVKQTDVHQGAIGRAATRLHCTLHHSAIKWNELRKHDFVVKTGLFYNKQK